MHNVLKVIVALPALLFIVIGIRWLVDPAGVAAEFGMPLLEGLGLSTQIGDLGGFFVGGGLMILIGVITQQKSWFLAPALMIALTAVFRLIAWQVHGAAFAAPQIAIEVGLTALLLFAASRAGQP